MNSSLTGAAESGLARFLPFARIGLDSLISLQTDLASRQSGRRTFPRPAQQRTTPLQFSRDRSLPNPDVRGRGLRRTSLRGDTRRRRSAAVGRGRQRQGAARRERHLSLVSGLDHQDHDRLRDAARGQGGPAHPRQADRRSRPTRWRRSRSRWDSRRHHGHRRQCAQDADGEVGERHGGRARRRRRRLDRELRRPDEPECAAGSA